MEREGIEICGLVDMGQVGEGMVVRWCGGVVSGESLCNK